MLIHSSDEDHTTKVKTANMSFLLSSSANMSELHQIFDWEVEAPLLAVCIHPNVYLR